MSRTTGETLREAILRGINEWWDRQDSGSCEFEDTSVVAAAIVEKLDIRREDVARVSNTPLLCNDPECDDCRLAHALTALLDCAEVEP